MRIWSKLGSVLDIDFYSIWALETLTVHTDGYTNAGNNSFVYFNPNQNAEPYLYPVVLMMLYKAMT